MRHRSIPLTFMVFDVLRIDGRGVTNRSYRERGRILEELCLEGPHGRRAFPKRTTGFEPATLSLGS
jgi:ATP-dependent DNA ligase